MAKQASYGRLIGKADGRSFYYSQVGGFVSRTINPAMSNRVKTDEAYANTRLNAAEFGGAGILAGSIISPVSQRWRYILNPTATGQLAKTIIEGMRTDTTNPWGQRVLPQDFMENVIAKYNSLSKNQMPDEIVQGLQTGNIAANGVEIFITNENVEVSANLAQQLKAFGAEGAICSVYLFRPGVSKFSESAGKYVKQDGRFTFVKLHESDFELAEGEIILESPSVPTPHIRTQYYTPELSADYMGGLLVVFTPYKVVSNEKHILQNLCSAYWQPMVRKEE